MAAIRPNPTLSEDLISEILVRVPVKSLLCFQSVSKTWLSLIKRPDFVKAQLLRAITIETDHTLITARFKLYEEDKIVLLHVDSRQIVADLKFPYSRGVFCTEVVGSANGIVCVDVYLNKIRSIYLWNPAIRQYKLIPSYSICNDFRVEASGFGYDQVDHDYKVVRVVSRPSFFAEVYSANQNVWRKLPDMIDIPLICHINVCVNGFLCGIGENGMMMAFDLNREVLNCTIKLPVIYDNVDDDARIIEFNKSMVVIIMMDNGLNDNNEINMWMLDDVACLRGGGVEASWMPMFSIRLDRPGSIVHGFFSNGDLLLKIIDDDNVWISCNVNKNEAKNIVPISIDMAEHIYNRHIYKYTESLVSLAGFKQVNWNAGGDDN